MNVLKNELEDVELDVVEKDDEQNGGDEEDDVVGDGEDGMEHGKLEVEALRYDK